MFYNMLSWWRQVRRPRKHGVDKTDEGSCDNLLQWIRYKKSLVMKVSSIIPCSHWLFSIAFRRRHLMFFLSLSSSSLFVLKNKRESRWKRIKKLLPKLNYMSHGQDQEQGWWSVDRSVRGIEGTREPLVRIIKGNIKVPCDLLSLLTGKKEKKDKRFTLLLKKCCFRSITWDRKRRWKTYSFVEFLCQTFTPDLLFDINLLLFIKSISIQWIH